MNPDIKAKWVTALRSGDYEQTRGVLTRYNAEGKSSHCCLGVLCEIAKDENVIQNSDATVDGYSSKVAVYDGSFTTLPDSVSEWAGLANEDKGDGIGNPYVPYTVRGSSRTQFQLAELNDGSDNYNINPLTFEQIADIIEEHL